MINRISALVLLASLSCTVSLSARQCSGKKDTQDKIDSIVTKILSAYGGIGAITKFIDTPKKYVGKKYYRNFKAIQFMSVEAGSKQFYSYSNSEGQENRAVADGHVLWELQDGKFHIYSKSEAEVTMFHRDLGTVQRLLKRMKDSSAVSLLPDKDVDHCACAGICFDYDSRRKVELWISKRNYLVRACKSIIQKENVKNWQEYAVETCYFEDYHKISGSWIPYKRKHFCNGKLSYTSVFDQVLMPVDVHELLGPNKFCLPNRFTSDLTVAFELESGRGRLILRGEINHEPVKILLDTGSPVTFVNRFYATSNDIPLVRNSKHVQSYLFSRKFWYKAVLQQLSIGDAIKLSNVMVDVDADQEPNYALTIGMDLLREHVISIDFHKRTITFSEKDSPNPTERRTRVPLQVFGKPFVESELNGSIHCPFVVDTGFSGNLLLLGSSAFAKDHFSTNTTVESPIADGNARVKIAKTITVDSLEFGEVHLLRPSIKFIRNRGPYYGAIGMKFLKNYRKVIIDFPSENMTLISE